MKQKLPFNVLLAMRKEGKKKRISFGKLLYMELTECSVHTIHNQVSFIALGVSSHTVMRYKSGAFLFLGLIHQWSGDHNGTMLKYGIKSLFNSVHM